MNRPSVRPCPVVDMRGRGLQRGLSVAHVRLDDALLEPRRRLVREVTLPLQYQRLEQSGVISNFVRAIQRTDTPFRGKRYGDSDLYKWIEAAAWVEASGHDERLSRLTDASLDLIEQAQQADGYINTYFSCEREGERWSNVAGMNEFYVAGHLFHAAVAHVRTTGSTRLLTVAQKLADRMCEVFGPREGQMRAIDSHPGVEMALVELARTTGEAKYAELAAFFLDLRGHGLVGGTTYNQDDVPLRARDTFEGHAVCAGYLCAGAADVYAETGDPRLLAALMRLWDDMTTRKMYVSGGIGSRWLDESVGLAFELPNSRAYAETCAAISSFMWNWRLLLLLGDARYADLMETVLYNAVLPGMSLDGRTFFYQNPLADDGSHRRSAWFDIACCPPNLARLLSSLPGYVYTTAGPSITVQLYVQSDADIRLDDGRRFPLSQHTGYPWDGRVRITVDGEGEMDLRLRVPAWSQGVGELSLNGRTLHGPAPASRYVSIRREWSRGDVLVIDFPMEARTFAAHPYVAENTGRVAVKRGPVLYCVEATRDRPADPRDIRLPVDGPFVAKWDPQLLGGVVTLQTLGLIASPGAQWDHRLYQPTDQAPQPAATDTTSLQLIPYFAWGNRERGRMAVWLSAAAPDHDHPGQGADTR